MAISQNQLAGDQFDNDIEHFQSKQAGIYTSLPGVIISYDPATNTASVQPAIQGIFYQSNQGVSQSQFVNLPTLIYCPVIFQHGGGVWSTYPITKGDECLISFSCRCIDAWWQNGAYNATTDAIIPGRPLEFRMHDLSDGFVQVGPCSVPNVIPNISTTSFQLRTASGTTYIEINPTNNQVNIVGAASLNVNTTGNTNITSPTVAITGNLTVNGNTSFTGQVHANGHVIDQTHVHSGVQTGTGNTGVVT